MKKTVLIVFPFVLALLYGCTPLSEDIARKADAGAPVREEIGSAPDSTSDDAGLIDPPTERCIRTYGPTIKRYSERYGFDWRLILAIMKQESRFSRVAESTRGAEGLMQLMPVTGEEMARKLDLDDLSHPEYNIQAGIFYFRKLYDLFEGAGEADRLKLTLAAYNAGLSRVYDAQELATYLHEKPTEWRSVRDALPLLSKRFYTLHRSVWGQDRPRSGWFGNAGQTLKYVDAVMDFYDDFRLALN
ncbi:MAG TPA: transglycosylase SLT domain-containing protein [Bacteroidota bacterium]|nr:transglycosylase SLT domain-containing protein [Bacteroidota bacterium]